MSIRVKVSLFSILRMNRFSQAEVELSQGATLTDLLDKLDLAREDIGMVMINARSGRFEQALESGDHVTLIPAIGGG